MKLTKFIVLGLILLSGIGLIFVNFNNIPYANVNEKSEISEPSNTELTDDELTDTEEIFEEDEPKASTDITVGGTYTGITYSGTNVYIETNATVNFVRCTFEVDLIMQDNLDRYTYDVTADLCTFMKIYFADGDNAYGIEDKLVVTNSTLNKLLDQSSTDPSQSIELTNCSFIDESETYSVYIYYSDVNIKNCSFVSDVYKSRAGNTFVIEDSNPIEYLGFGDEAIDITIRNCEIKELKLRDGDDTTVQDTVCQNINLEINASIDGTLELTSYTANTVFSNVYLKADPPPGEFSRIYTYANLNASDITDEILSKLYILEYQNSNSYIKNCSLAYYLNSYFTTGVSTSDLRNCTFQNAWIRSNQTYITNCDFYNKLDVDTNSYPWGGSNLPFILEDSNFYDATIHVLSGGVDIDNCDFKTDMGYLWIDTYVYSYDNKKDTFAIINNSNPKVINLALNTSLIAENLDCNSITMRDTSQATFDNVDVGTMNVLDSATATIDNCHINSHNFGSPNVQITNSIVDSMAPTLDPIPNPLDLGNLKNFILNWSSQPGTNFTGNIVSYKVFRAAMGIGGAAPSSIDYTLIHTINTPVPTNPLDTKYNDTALEPPSGLDGFQIYYIVEITDQGGNSGNSSYLDTVYDTGTVLDTLDATVVFDDSLTTYDAISVTVFMLDSDINNNGTEDCQNASLFCQFRHTNGLVENFVYDPLGTSIDGVIYYFEIPKTVTAVSITFSVVVRQKGFFDGYGIGLYNFNSTTKYGKEFSLSKPTFAFEPVDHPTDDTILATDKVEISVSVLHHAEYVSSIWVYYREDDGKWEKEVFEYDTEDLEFSVKLPKFDPCELEYYVTFVDLAGLEYKLLASKDDPESIEVIPEFPQEELEVSELAVIFIGSALVGIGFGILYMFLDMGLKKRTNLKRTQKLKSLIKSYDETKKGSDMKKSVKKAPLKKKVKGK